MAKAKPKTKNVAGNAEKAVATAVAKMQAPRRNGVYRITLTAVYNNDAMDAESISDGVFEAMTKVGKGLALLHVDSVKAVAKPEEAIAKILAEVSGQTQDAMSSRKTDDGKEFVAVNAKKKAKSAKKP